MPIQFQPGRLEVRPQHDLVTGNGAKDSLHDAAVRRDNKDAMKMVRHGAAVMSN
jgi:hypothetical protein